MTTEERRLLAQYDMALTAYHRDPNYLAAALARGVAARLIAISDDWQELLDEADELDPDEDQ